MTASGWGKWGGELSRKEKGLMDMDNSVVIAGERGSIVGINGNENNIIKIKFFKKDSNSKLDNCYSLIEMFCNYM